MNLILLHKSCHGFDIKTISFHLLHVNLITGCRRSIGPRLYDDRRIDHRNDIGLRIRMEDGFIGEKGGIP